VLTQISDVWHPTLFTTAETVQTEIKLCEFGGENIARLRSRSFGFGDFEQTQTRSVRQSEQVRWNTKICE
jgi:hypothetical protein